MSLRVVMGPMFAGKTSEIQGVVRRNQCLGRSVLVLTADIDNRYQSDVAAIINHDRTAIPARAISVDALMTVLEWSDFAVASAVVIDEAQFFRRCLVDFVKAAVDDHGKHVTVVGLDGDAERRPFGNVLDLVPLADSVVKLTALCRQCGDGTAAIFTRSLASRSDQVAVGGAEMYEPVCRRHFGAGGSH
jgi:thymidine kinase